MEFAECATQFRQKLKSGHHEVSLNKLSCIFVQKFFIMNRIGERIKRKRELQNLHLKELAIRVGISSSALSQIEKSKSFPSIITLKSIAENLHTTVGELIGENEALVSNPVVLRSDMKYVDQNKSGTIIYLLSHHDINKQMDTFLPSQTRNHRYEQYILRLTQSKFFLNC